MGLDASYIKTLMERENVTQAKLARMTDIPHGTLSQILNGTTDCPTFANVTAIVKALHGSLDVMAGDAEAVATADCDDSSCRRDAGA